MPNVVAQGSGSSPALTRDDSLARDILRELVHINTAPSGGLMSRASEAVSRRLLAAGYAAGDVELAGPDAKHRNVIARLRGRTAGAKPILLMAHLDVVDAKASDWSFDPFTLREADGFLYGRGTTDNKGGVAVLVANMIRWKRERFVPSRDVIMILTTDEELTGANGIEWLLKNRPELAKAEYALNADAGGLLERPGQRTAFYVSSAEKVYQTYTLEVTNRGGHSSVPRADNAIYTLAKALGRLEAFRFPVMLNDVTRAYFTRSAELESGQLAEDMRAAGAGETSGAAIDRLSQDPQFDATLRTTCVATMLTAGHAENALPQVATATVNCRILPGTEARDVEAALNRVVADTSIHIRPTDPSIPSPASPLRTDVLSEVESVARSIWPDAETIPMMDTGASDGLFLRNVGVPVYGVSGSIFDLSDFRAHGRDERLSVRHLQEAREFWYNVVRQLTRAPVS